MKSDILCACVVYPGIEKYLKQFMDSINNQDFRSFDLLIIDNGLNGDYSKLTINYVVVKSEINNPVINRKKIVQYAIKKQYKKLIFFDSDDLYYKSRVRVINEKLNQYGLVIHNMSVINCDGEITNRDFYSNKLCTGEIKFDDILKHNFSGLGNSGYLVNQLTNATSVRDDIIAFDWWLALNVLSQSNGYYTSEILCEYRRYDNNTTFLEGVEKAVEIEYVEKMRLYDEVLHKCKLSNLQSGKISKTISVTKENYNEKRKFKKNKSEFWWDLLNKE